jgi:hypothetical protein
MIQQASRELTTKLPICADVREIPLASAAKQSPASNSMKAGAAFIFCGTRAAREPRVKARFMNADS